MKYAWMLALLGLAACAPAKPADGAARGAAAQRIASIAMPFGVDRLSESFAGTAREVVHVSGYTYVAVDVGEGRIRWAVCLAREIEEGARVRVRAFGKKSAFESKKLGRTFDELWFAIVTEEKANETQGAQS